MMHEVSGLAYLADDGWELPKVDSFSSYQNLSNRLKLILAVIVVELSMLGEVGKIVMV